MKRKQRVPKGEKYWYLAGNLKVKSTIEKDTIYDKSEWFNHNYFHTEEEANQMLKKLSAVLNGADVIEMPSDEEIVRYPTTWNETLQGFSAFIKGIEWLKSKIVK